LNEHLGRTCTADLFAHEELWQMIQVFYGHIDRLSEQRRKLVLEFNRDKCDNEEDISRADASMISAYRADLYIPESPQKSQVSLSVLASLH
jgi:hypothetical protein